MIFSQRAHLAIEKNLRFFFNGSPWGKPLNPKSKNTVIREKNIFDFDPCLSLVDTRFVFTLSRIHKKDISECLRATQ